MSDTPTYEQLSALCAQMAAALDDLLNTRHDSDRRNAIIMRAINALKAHATLSPDPQWQRVPSKGDLIRLIGAEIWVESEDDRCKSEIRGLDDAASAILNRLDFSRQSARLRECNSENAEYAARILRCADELEQPVSSLTSASMTQASRFLRAFACDVANRARGEG